MVTMMMLMMLMVITVMTNMQSWPGLSWYGEQKHEHFQIKSFDDDDDGGHSTGMIPVKSNMSEVSDKMKKNCRAEQDEIGMESYRRAQIAREQGVWDKEVMIMMVMMMTMMMVVMWSSVTHKVVGVTVRRGKEEVLVTKDEEVDRWETVLWNCG